MKVTVTLEHYLELSEVKTFGETAHYTSLMGFTQWLNNNWQDAKILSSKAGNGKVYVQIEQDKEYLKDQFLDFISVGPFVKNVEMIKEKSRKK